MKKPRIFTELIDDDEYGKTWKVWMDPGYIGSMLEFQGWIMKERDGSGWLYKTTFPGTQYHRSYQKALSHYRKMWT